MKRPHSTNSPLLQKILFLYLYQIYFIVKSYINFLFKIVLFERYIKSTHLIDLKTIRVCPFTMLNKCAKFKKYPCRVFFYTCFHTEHKHTHSSAVIQVARGDKNILSNGTNEGIEGKKYYGFFSFIFSYFLAMLPQQWL